MINTELLLAAWLEKLQKKWDTEEYYYDVEEAKKSQYKALETAVYLGRIQRRI